MKSDNLLKKMRSLGFSLLDTEQNENPNATLAEVVRTKDLRFWEGFAIALANAEEKGLFNLEKVLSYLKQPSDRRKLESLLALSLALYKYFNLHFSWEKEVYQRLTPQKKNEIELFLQRLNNGEVLNVTGNSLSSNRLKAVFNNYFKQKQTRLHDLLATKEELGLEYALSQVFSPKQKDLFLKKLRREKMTKTEQEYYSRVVKKKVLALTNPELQRLARKLF